MNPPTTYSQWIDCFDGLKAGLKDEEAILLMERGTIDWTPGVAERLTQQLYEVIDFRLRKTSDQFQKELNVGRGDEMALVQAILSVRKRLAFLKRIAQLPAFPEQVNEAMYTILSDYAKKSQQSLEDSAKSDRTGRLRITIKNNPITSFDQVELVFGSSSETTLKTKEIITVKEKQAGSKLKTAGRRVIFK